MFAFLIGIIGVLIALIGWFFFNSILLLTIGTTFYIIESILERKNLNSGAKLFDIVLFGIGCLIAAIMKMPFYVGGMVAINCYSAIIGLFGFISYVNQFRLYLRFINETKSRKTNNKL